MPTANAGMWRFTIWQEGDDVAGQGAEVYIAFKRIKNFACAEVYPQAKVVTVYLKVDPRLI